MPLPRAQGARLGAGRYHDSTRATQQAPHARHSPCPGEENAKPEMHEWQTRGNKPKIFDLSSQVCLLRHLGWDIPNLVEYRFFLFSCGTGRKLFLQRAEAASTLNPFTHMSDTPLPLPAAEASAPVSSSSVSVTWLTSGKVLNIAANTSRTNRPIVVGDGAKLVCAKGSTLTSGVARVSDEGYKEYNPTVVVRSGGTLEAKGLTISGTLILEPGAILSGNIHFAKGSRICLLGWEGDAKTLLDTLLKNVSWTAASPPLVEVATYGYLNNTYLTQTFTGDVVLSKLSSKFGDYILPGNSDYTDYTLTVKKGVNIIAENDFYGTKVVFEGSNVVRAGTNCATMPCCTIVAHGTRFDVPISNLSPGRLSGENVTFAAKVPFILFMDPHTKTWNGSASALQSQINAALKNVSGYKITASQPRLGVSLALGKDLVLSKSTVASMTPKGFSGLYFDELIIQNGHKVTVNSGGILDADNVDIEGRSSLVLKSGAKLMNSLPDGVNINVAGDAKTCGSLSATGVDLTNVEIYAHGNLNLRNCWGKGKISFSSTYQHGTVRIKGCDLSKMSIELLSDTYGGGSSSVIFDLSGNYWGTTSIKKIQAKIKGFNAKRVKLGSVLSSPPRKSDSVAPKLKLGSVQTKKAGTNKSTITLRWTCNESATFVVKMDNKTVYRGKSKKITLRKTDGLHKFTVTATDASGNSSTRSGSFRTDTTPPTRPLSLTTKQQNSTRRISFSWKASKDAGSVRYELRYKLVGAKNYKYSKGFKVNARSLALKQGRYSWAVRARDSKGNISRWVAGKTFQVDFTAPKLRRITRSIRKLAEGKGNITLRWKSSESATYVVKADGIQVYSGKSAKCTFSLAEGYYKYSITATDAAGNSRTYNGAFRVDVTPPTTPTSPWAQVTTAGRKVTLRWTRSTDANGVSYEVAFKKVGTRSYTYYKGISGTSKTLRLAAGTNYCWGVRARDSQGNYTSWVWSDSFNSSDRKAPNVSVSTPTQQTANEGKATVTFRWSCDETANFVLSVDGKQVYSGKGTTVTYALADGSHKYVLTARDTAGNTTTRSGSFLVDTTASGLSSAPAAGKGEASSAAASSRLDDELGLSAGLPLLPQGGTALVSLAGCTLSPEQKKASELASACGLVA